MRSAIAVFVLAAATIAFAQDPQPAAHEWRIRGKVTAADTGQPIAEAEVRITGGTFTSLKPRLEYTGDDGTYEVTGLAPGRYSVTVSRVGYVSLEYGQQRPYETGIAVVVSASTATDQINVALPKGAVIVVRVIDGFGDPAAGYTVRAFRRSVPSEPLRPVGSGGLYYATDDRGEIRVWGLAPGEYYIGVSAGILLGAVNPSQRAEGQTFYPGTTEAGAAPVTVALGEQVFVEIPLTRRRASRLSGVVVGDVPFSDTPTVLLSQRIAGSTGGHSITVRQDGSFTATELAPAEYQISARVGTLAGSLTVQVSGEDVDGLVVRLKQAVSLRGRISFDAKPPARAQWPSGSLIRTVFTEGGGSTTMPAINADWTFEIPGVTGIGVLRFSQLPAGWFLKAVVIDGKDVTDTPMDFGSVGNRPIDVQLTQRLAQVSGTVVDDSNRPTRAYSVVVFPEEAALWTAYSRFLVAARPDQDGRFVVSGLPAGKYLVRAVEYLAQGAERNRDTLERLRAGATVLTLKDQESATLTLRLTQ